MSVPHFRFVNGVLNFKSAQQAPFQEPTPVRPVSVQTATIPVAEPVVVPEPVPEPEPAPVPEPVPEPELVPEPTPEPPVSEVEAPAEVTEAPAESGLVPEDPPAE
jgi:hypothetical protein